MWKKWIAFLLCLPLFFVTAHAAEPEEGDFDYEAQLEASGAQELYRSLPDDTIEYMRQAGLDSLDYHSLSGLNAASAVHSVMNMAEKELKTPLAAAGFLMAVLLLASFVKGGEKTLHASMAPAVGTVVSAAVSITLAAPVFALIQDIADVVEAACTFTEAFGAVFTGILLVNGQTVSAAGYSAFLFGAVELSSLCVGELILPLLQIFLALSCVSAVSGSLHIEAFTEFFEKNAKWLLSFLGVLLSSILGISGMISASADNVASRTAKFVISGSVPVVGGAVSDAYLSIKSGMTLLRDSVGAFGIIALGYIYLPLILRTVLWNAALQLAMMLCETLDLGDIGKPLKSAAGVLSLMLGVTVFSLFLLTLGSIVVLLQKPS